MLSITISMYGHGFIELIVINYDRVLKLFAFFSQIFCISQSVPQLPLQIEDAMRPENTEVRDW